MAIRHKPWFKDRRYTEVWVSDDDGKSWHMTHMEGPGEERTVEEALDSVEKALDMESPQEDPKGGFLMIDMRTKAIELADEWRGEFWKSGLIYAFIYIGDSIREAKKS